MSVRNIVRNVSITVSATLCILALSVLPAARAIPVTGCQDVAWGFFFSQRRSICDSPIAANGTWMRTRVIWTPAHSTGTYCSTNGSQFGSSFTSCYGGQMIPARIDSRDFYPVTDDSVPDGEPGHLDNGGLGGPG